MKLSTNITIIIILMTLLPLLFKYLIYTLFISSTIGLLDIHNKDDGLLILFTSAGILKNGRVCEINKHVGILISIYCLISYKSSMSCIYKLFS